LYSDGCSKKQSFLRPFFFRQSGNEFDFDNRTIIDKFNSITGIEERKYISSELKTSDIAHHAAQKAIEDADIDPETLDYIIVCPQFW
jgi:3-oxoacyl-[acyl-carrier-protein] synthase-3